MTELPKISTGRSRSRLLGGWNEWLRATLPLVLLLLALATLFLFDGGREYFYRGGVHDWNSSQTLAFAESLSFRHNLLIFHYESRDAAGNLRYPSPYTRFPLGGYALVKLAILPFGEEAFRAKIYAGRMLMLLLYSGAAVLAYCSLARISGSRWGALVATLLAFSSYNALYYADKISNEVTIDLFAVMLAFHGMVVFVQEGRFRQLVIKSCLALLLGWHVYAFLLPFIVFGLPADIFKSRRAIWGASSVWGRVKGCGMTLLRSRYWMLGVVTLVTGVAILTFNFGNEYFALDGEVPLRELPSLGSAVRRTGLDQDFNARAAHWVEPQVYWPNQFYRVMQSTLPAAANIYSIKTEAVPNFGYLEYPGIALGALALLWCLAGVAIICVRGRPGMAILLATLVFSGFCYAVLLRYNIAHHFESVFYIGLPMTAYTLALLCWRRVFRVRGFRIRGWRVRLAPFLGVAAAAVFVISVWEIGSIGQSRAELAVEAELMAEYKAIRDLVADRATIYVPWQKEGLESGGGAWAWAYFLAGKKLVSNDDYIPRKPYQAGDYLLLHARADSPALLTPENRHVFLYDGALYNKWRRYGSLGDPIIAVGGWQVYLTNAHLTYASQECANVGTEFFLHVVPRTVADLPAVRQGHGYDNRDFTFRGNGGLRIDGDCVLINVLPEYDIISFRTGQYTEGGRVWEGEYRLPAR